MNYYPAVLNGGVTLLGPSGSGTVGQLLGLVSSTQLGFVSVDLSAYAKTSSLATVATSGKYADLLSTPTLGTASAKDIPASGNATATQVVYGTDTRLSDARTPTAHTHKYADISDPPTIPTAYTLPVATASVLGGVKQGTGVTIAVDGTLSASGGIGGGTGATDNRVLRADGTGGSTIQSSAVTIDDSGNVSGVGTFATSGVATFGAAPTSPHGSTSERWGASASASGIGSIAFGASNTATGNYAISIGQGTSVTASGGGNTIGIGSLITVSGSGTVAIGGSCTASSAVLVGIGGSLTNGHVCIGPSTVSNFASGSIGPSNTVSHIGCYTIGNMLTTARRNEFVIGCSQTGGTGAWTGGHRVRVCAETSTAATRTISIIDHTWATATDASRQSRTDFYTSDATADRMCLSIGTNGTAPLVGFYGVSPVARQTLPNAGSVTAADIRTALINLGLCQ